MTTANFYDIETEALPEQEIAHLMPEFQAPANYKDPEKIKANIEQQRQDWIKNAALSPITGRVLAIGVWPPLEDGVIIVANEDEKVILARFWRWVNVQIWAGHKVVGWCCHQFDLPFLIKRSLRHSLEVPKLRTGAAFQYWHDQMVDLAVRWQFGDKQSPHSLDTVAKFLGVGSKNGNGAEFGALWHSDRPKAEEYLTNDLRLLRGIYERMEGIL